MREMIIRLMAVIMTAHIGESILPEGNMKKYASVLLSSIVCLCMVTAIYGKIPLEIPDLSDGFETEIKDTFSGEVLADYKKRAETEIEKNCGSKPEITVSESGMITHVKFHGEPQNITYLKDKMGVAENEIEITDK